jgi:hypothetical protein
MNDIELNFILTMLGQVMPNFVDLINRNIANSKVRFWITFAVCTTIGAVINLGILSFHDLKSIALSGLILWGASQAAYKTYYEGSSTQTKIRFSNTLNPFPQK